MSRLVLAVLLLAPVAADAAPAPKKSRIAVMEIRHLGADAQLAELLSEVALTEAATRGVDVIGRSDITSMLGFEKQKQMLGCAEDSSCLAEIGGALGVDQVLVGSLGRIGTTYRLDLKLVDARKARVLSRFGESVSGSEENLVNAVERGVRRLLDAVAPPAPSASAAPTWASSPTATSARVATTASAPAAATVSAQPAKRGSSRRRWALAFGGVGLAFAGGGALVGVHAKSSYEDVRKASESGDVALYDSARTEAKKSAAVADVLFAASAASLVTGGVLWFTGRDAPVAVTVAPAPGGAAAVVRGEF